MEYRIARLEDAEQIYGLVQRTIRSAYPKYYPAQVVDFFCAHHSRESIVADIEGGSVRVLVSEGQVVGTGTRLERHITRVFVAPELQGQGLGSLVMQHLEDEIAQEYGKAELDASLAAAIFYQHRGYRTNGHEAIPAGERILVYETMEKVLGCC